MMDDEDSQDGSPPRIENDALSQLKIENIWSESTEDDVGPFSTCSISVDPALFMDDDGEGSEENGNSSVSRGSLPEVVLVEQQPAPNYMDRADSGDFPDDDDDPLSTDHLQVEVIEIDSSDGTEEWLAGGPKKGNQPDKEGCNGKATASGKGQEDKDGDEKKDGSEVDENSNSEWDFYSYLINMDDDESADGGGGSGSRRSCDTKRYVCYDCGFQTNRSDNFSKHVQTAHNDDNGSRKDDVEEVDDVDDEQMPIAFDEDDEEDESEMLECVKCDYRTKNRQHLRNHTRYRHTRGRGRPPATAPATPAPVLKCGQCPFATRHRPLLTQHLKQTHGAPVASVSVSASATTTQQGAGDVKYHCCDRCPYKTKWKHHIKEHYMFHHNEGEIEWHKCPLCDYQTKWKYHIKQHLKAKHADGREAATFSCPVPGCRFQTKWKPHFQRHLRQEHGAGSGAAAGVSGAPAGGSVPSVRLLPCPHCQYSTANRSNLNTHVRTQHGGGPTATAVAAGVPQPEVHQCDKCGFRTRWKHHLKNHWIMKHQENAVLPVFRCSECSYESKWKHHVKIHKENKHTQLPCERCPFVAHTKLEMRQHVKTCHHHPHNGPRIVSVEGGATGGPPALPPGLTYVWPPPHLQQQQQQRHQAPSALRCRLCGHVAPHRPALELHLRQRHSQAGGGGLSLQIPVLLRLPGQGGDHVLAGQPFHSGLGALDRRSLNAMAVQGGPLANGARMQLPVLLRLPADGGGAGGCPGPAAGLDLQSCFRMMSSLYGGPGRQASAPASSSSSTSAASFGHGEAPIVLLRCSDCPFQTASVDALKLHVTTRHRRQQQQHNGAATAVARRRSSEDDDDAGSEAGSGGKRDNVSSGMDDDETEAGRERGELRCSVCRFSCGQVDELVRHSRDEHGRTLVVNGASISLLPPEISVTPVQLAPRVPQPQ